MHTYHRFRPFLWCSLWETHQNATKGVSLSKIGHNESVSELFREVHDVMVTYKKQTCLTWGPQWAACSLQTPTGLRAHTVKDFCCFSSLYLFLLHGPAKIGWGNECSIYFQSARQFDDDIRTCDQSQPLFSFFFLWNWVSCWRRPGLVWSYSDDSDHQQLL